MTYDSWCHKIRVSFNCVSIIMKGKLHLSHEDEIARPLLDEIILSPRQKSTIGTNKPMGI